MPSVPSPHHSPSALCVALAALALSACTAGPDYKRPPPPAGTDATAFKEAQGWKAAAPGQVDALQPWWTWYGEEQLNQLVVQANKSNATLALAASQVRQAQALVQNAQAAQVPTLGVSAGGSRARSTSASGAAFEGDTHNWALFSSWEADLWGRVSRTVEASQASAQASASDLAAAKLSVQASLVNSYLQLRMTDAQLALYARTLQGYEKAFQLTQSQRRAGVATLSDVSLAETTLQAARAQSTELELTRKLLEHAIAVLLGKAPSEFALAPATGLADSQAKLPTLPGIPEVLPSTLLERRPDIAAAERRVAAANANIGVVEAAWYPKLSLSASAGNNGPHFGDWLAAPYRVWALGAQLAGTLFDGGLRTAQNQQAQAAFDGAAASYRQTVLAGFQEVEDNLAALNDLARERTQQNAAVAAAKTAERVLLSQYRAGTLPYTSVITVQALTLASERAALQLHSRQLTASVTLIKATGGGLPATSSAPAASLSN